MRPARSAAPWRAAVAVALAVMAGGRTASAEPVELSLQNEVPAGKRPTITLVAKEQVASVRLELDRTEDKKHFAMKAGPLAPGARAVLKVGDGKVGRAHWSGSLVVRAASGESRTAVTFESRIGDAGGGLKVGYDRAHRDLQRGRLEFTVSRPAKSAELVVVDDDGNEVDRVERSLADVRPGAWIPIDWKPSGKPVMRLQLTIDPGDGDRVLVRLVPWAVSIAHEEVVFPSGDAAVQPSEEAKLDASYQKIVDAVDKVRRHEPSLDVKVYVVGHTDTVGRADDNRRLSQARARSIARWFHDRGLPLPLHYAGVGEDHLRVPTADNVDEARNRRADYVVGIEEPAVGRGAFAALR